MVGYNGSDFHGSQKNNNVRTVEAEVEIALRDMNAIATYNYGDLKKISWSRATRTDKSVHALQNLFSCKVHASREQRENFLEPFRVQLNETLAKNVNDEIKIFNIVEVSNRFNAKLNASYREYSYYLPTYMLNPINKRYLGKKGTDLKPEEDIMPTADEITNVKVVNGITITKRLANEGDTFDDQEKYMGRDISHISQDDIESLYKTRLTAEQRIEVHDLFKNTFNGTKKYHNFTRDMRPDKMASQRFMIELTANDYMYVNKDTLQVTDENDPRALEFIHFYLKG